MTHPSDIENTYKPSSEDEVLQTVQAALSAQIPLEIIGHGSKRYFGHLVNAKSVLDLSNLSGITMFEPEELVLTAKAGTPLAEINALLDENNQELQFEPMGTDKIWDANGDRGTLGGLINTNLSGPRRIKSGSARDHVLGVRAVSGRGEVFKSGGRVVKNVTGYDLSKGLTGSFGTLAVLTEITMKVLPKAETEMTLLLRNLSNEQAMLAMSQAMGSNAEVSGAAHLPATKSEASKTCLRLEGFAQSVDYRIGNLAKFLDDFPEQERLEKDASQVLWADIRNCAEFAKAEDCLWRISCTPMQGAQVVDAIEKQVSCEVRFDWQGGLIWLALPEPNEPIIREAVANFGGGHSTLLRRGLVEPDAPVFQPQPQALQNLSRRIKENFDPKYILNPGKLGVW